MATNSTFEILGQSYMVNPELEADVCDWISEITGSTKAGTTQEWLRDGKVLVALFNKLKPAAKLRANKLNKPFMMRENITMFLRAARQFYPRLKESDFFSTDDLYDGKDMTQVINFIYSFGGVVQLDPDSAGLPCLGVAQTASTKIDARRNKDIGNVDLSMGFSNSTAVDAPLEYVGGRPACVTGDSNAYDDSLDDRKKVLAQANSISDVNKAKEIMVEEKIKAERVYKDCEFDCKPVGTAQADDSEDSAAEEVVDQKPSSRKQSQQSTASSHNTMKSASSVRESPRGSLKRMSERRSTLNARLNCNNSSKTAPPVKPLNQNVALKQMPNLPCPAPAGKKDKKKKKFLCCW